MGNMNSMGGSEFDNLPISACPYAYEVMRTAAGQPDRRFISQGGATLVLREHIFSWSGDDCSISDVSGNGWFKIKGKVMSLHGKSTMMDIYGMEIAGFEKKMFSLHGTSHITVNINGVPHVVATIKAESSFQLRANSDVYIHQVPNPNIDAVSCDGMQPAIQIRGDIISKKYDFMVPVQGGLVKIAQVVRSWQGFAWVPDSYYLQIGPGCDVAFITLLAFALDEMWSDNKQNNHHHHGGF